MNPRGIAGISIALLCVAALFAVFKTVQKPRLRVETRQLQMPADGRFHFAGTALHASAAISVSGLPAHLLDKGKDSVSLMVQSPVLPGDKTLKISDGKSEATLRLHFAPASGDSAGDGTPDFLRLHTAEDRNAFRGWFTAMAEAAADLPPDKLPGEIDDCAALLRWCYRNALHAHDESWLASAPAGLDLSQPSIGQYVYPQTPLGAGLFRTRDGSFAQGDESNGAFAQFADARTLWRWNTFFLSRDVQRARPGDLLFFRQLEQNSPYHSMIVTGAAQKWVIYHTGPIGEKPGEVRRVLLQDLLQHPDPRWRPNPENSNFLGVYRWNILREDSE
ncbi:DUF1175 domain-containing protein [Silvibacterium acidisoli]|uniref:DUF1175 domain-containing protein n=1 Tax=Acidobacteriaceae bacterium ZG23-2 TaxID=2883246 RepID=UPI00406BFBB6